MGPMSSTETLSGADRQTLLQVARESITHGLTGERYTPEISDYPVTLQEARASFVTLKKSGQLRGCIGTLEARAALVLDVADNAHGAAFRDPRFPSLAVREFDDLEFHISVLSVPERMQIESEEDLLHLLRPGIDGLILESGRHRGTFLPAVWEQLPEPGEFLTHLKHKAGLPGDHWPEDIRVHRYTTESFE